MGDTLILGRDLGPGGRLSYTLRSSLELAIVDAINKTGRTVTEGTRVPRRISFTRLKQVPELLELRGSLGGMTSAMGCTEFSLGTDGTGFRGTNFIDALKRLAKGNKPVPFQLI